MHTFDVSPVYTLNTIATIHAHTVWLGEFNLPCNFVQKSKQIGNERTTNNLSAFCNTAAKEEDMSMYDCYARVQFLLHFLSEVKNKMYDIQHTAQTWRGYSSVVEHSTADREVPGSNPGAP